MIINRARYACHQSPLLKSNDKNSGSIACTGYAIKINIRLHSKNKYIQEMTEWTMIHNLGTQSCSQAIPSCNTHFLWYVYVYYISII